MADVTSEHPAATGGLTRGEARARAELIAQPTYTVELDLTTGDQSFGCTAVIDFQCRRPGSETFLDLHAAELRSAELNGAPLPKAAFDGRRLRLGPLAAENQLRIRATLDYSHHGIGLHRFQDPVDGEVYLYTDFEPREAHRVYPCFDQPDIKGTIALAVIAPAGWQVLANTTPERRPTPGSAGRWEFPRTAVLPTYVTAMCAGPYHAVRGQHRGIELGVHCRRSLAPHLDAAEILEVTRQGFDFFTELFAYSYPFGKYDQVFVPQFNSGAMENVGCVTFNESMIFRAKVTESDREERALVILHELAHMWFGNLVTMRWWDDLWLNESFATYMGQLALGRATRFQNAWTSFARTDKPWAAAQDQLPTTHPIVADVPDTEAARTQFDGISYAKGAAVLKQLVAWVGEEAFTAGIQRYFRAHEYGNADLAAFLSALASASGRPLERWAEVWLERAGVNTLSARTELAERGKIARFTVAQTAPPEWPTLRPHRIGVGLYDLAGGRLTRRRLVATDVEGEATPVPAIAGEALPDLVLLNDKDLSYTKIRLDERSWKTMQVGLATLDDSLARVLLWNAAWDQVRDGEGSARHYVDLVNKNVHGEDDAGVLRSLLGQAQMAVAYYVAAEYRAEEREKLALASAAALAAAPPGSDHQLVWAQTFVRTARSAAHRQQIRAWLTGGDLPAGLTMDRDLRWIAVVALAALGELEEAEIERELALERNDWSERRAATARAARPAAEAKATAWAAIAEDPATPLATSRALQQGFMRTDQDRLLEPYVARYFGILRRIWQEREPEVALSFAGGMYPSVLVSSDLIAKTDAELSAGSLAPVIRRRLLEQRDHVERALRARASDSRARAD
ncbi:MAG TPA: aminopeptidase N, partial [Candidatus Udaeobacter sp.]|nr:aminopeptidase N [Candidatus Udaeobacter sp.]